MTEEVAVLGGGVAGLSAAHELTERGFDVSVFEASDALGGKARSVTVPETAVDGAGGLPGEHGFRFFPGFYRHITETMARTPDGSGGTVEDHLVATDQTLIASVHGPEKLADTGTPATVKQWFERLMPGRDGNLPAREAAFFAERLLEILTSCEARRVTELDEVTWWDFIEADRMSDAYRAQLAQATQSLVALRPRQASARTMGLIYFQLLRGGLDPRLAAERILDGPTSDVWIAPWRRYLESLGVNFVMETRVTGLHLDGTRLSLVTVEGPDGSTRISADQFVLAVPVEAARTLLTDEIRAVTPELDGLDELDTAWMNGLQFYLREDVQLARGHQLYVDSAWALTSVSQAQFWDTDLRERSGGEVGGVLSVIVSDWQTPGPVHGKPAKECSPEEIREEVWTQLTDHLNRDGNERLTEDMVVSWFLDPSISAKPDGTGVTNDAPLLVNTVGSLKHRPSANPPVDGLYLAADYVRTHTDLASMECANEAARRAVNALLDATGSDAKRCKLAELPEPAVFAPLKKQDELAYRLGLPHPGHVRRDVGASVRRLLGASD